MYYARHSSSYSPHVHPAPHLSFIDPHFLASSLATPSVARPYLPPGPPAVVDPTTVSPAVRTERTGSKKSMKGGKAKKSRAAVESEDDAAREDSDGDRTGMLMVIGRRRDRAKELMPRTSMMLSGVGPRALKAREWRHKLQTMFLSGNKALPKEDCVSLLSPRSREMTTATATVPRRWWTNSTRSAELQFDQGEEDANLADFNGIAQMRRRPRGY
ncbi:hypothetical protein B0H12DRAFT_1071943 [Mycena haematopus]|nr:hypothetical protein B0H12DRAFT_1071943 [Mycena haematopus]